MKTQITLITLLAAMIQAKPRRSYNSLQQSDTRQFSLNYDSKARMYAKIRANTRRIARKIRLENSLKKRQSNNFGAMDLDESRRHRKIQDDLKKNGTVVVKPKFFDAEGFRKERNTHRLLIRRTLIRRKF